MQPTDPLRDDARRLLRVHDLRAADALHLAAAFAAAEGRPPTLDFVCLDERLAAAAEREGFRIVGGASGPAGGWRYASEPAHRTRSRQAP